MKDQMQNLEPLYVSMVVGVNVNLEQDGTGGGAGVVAGDPKPWRSFRTWNMSL
jgi:hypothetical protein